MSDLLQQLNAEMATIVEDVRHSLVRINNGRGGAGAGTVWHPDGLILTNAHVVGRRALKVTLSDGRSLPARLLAHDANYAIELGDSGQLQSGHWVLALGHPWGVPGAVTAGIVIGVGPLPEMPTPQRELIHVSLHLRPGDSGGPLVDVHGRLVGINTMMAGPDVGVAVPVHVVKTFLRQALEPQKTASLN
ncbi:MAG: trypsin-like peptidase domain-containing protein [Anaerolineae bacterium]